MLKESQKKFLTYKNVPFPSELTSAQNIFLFRANRLILFTPKYVKPIKKNVESENLTNRAGKITSNVKNKSRFSRIFKTLKTPHLKLINAKINYF